LCAVISTLLCMLQTSLSVIFVLFVFATDNKPIPTDLRKEAISIHKTLDWDDEGGDGRCRTFVLEEQTGSNCRQHFICICFTIQFLISHRNP